ncbi:uncharacterized protein LOC142576252 isoform X2 [Dermacentor variabilis]|uniref:uncharacterized protein LOC142576252 isoform X2 n=1 Tax=Dermacentor variabilis TaxID=34621 RepID=UPI003F5B9049
MVGQRNGYLGGSGGGERTDDLLLHIRHLPVSKEFRRPCDVDGTEPPWLVSITSSEALEGRADCTSALFSDLSSWAEALRLANSRDGIACFAAGGAA